MITFSNKNALLAIVSSIFIFCSGFLVLIVCLLSVAPGAEAAGVHFYPYEIQVSEEIKQTQYIQLSELDDGSITIQNIGEQPREFVESSRERGLCIFQPDTGVLTLTPAPSNIEELNQENQDAAGFDSTDSLISTLERLSITSAIPPTQVDEIRLIFEGTYTAVLSNQHPPQRVTPIERLIELIGVLQNRLEESDFREILKEIESLNLWVLVPELAAINNLLPVVSVAAINVDSPNNSLSFQLRETDSALTVDLRVEDGQRSIVTPGRSNEPGAFQTITFQNRPGLCNLSENPEACQEQAAVHENFQEPTILSESELNGMQGPDLGDHASTSTPVPTNVQSDGVATDNTPADSTNNRQGAAGAVATGLQAMIDIVMEQLLLWGSNQANSLLPVVSGSSGDAIVSGVHFGSVMDPAAELRTQAEQSAAAAVNAEDTGSEGCEHYQRRCLVNFECCNETWWPCHRCHNDRSDCGTVKLKARNAKKIKCCSCKEEQGFNEFCQKCGIKFSEYFCPHCQQFSGLKDSPHHCNKCGICRIHGDSSFHCDGCGVCLDNHLKDNHPCSEKSAHEACCVCSESVFFGCKILPCGHKIHQNCANNIIKDGIKNCPTCQQRFVYEKKK
ncbi:CHY zinc finger protein [Endozoicomonas euniceicola]|uniref:CHY zinc finger protein n=1 Tax=Endozoicomonas euniceicola TaxID=1234143 RepID=A0ABY6GNC8_9GAMM|nr:CHY zinc finger protein [Endozoicomonas euniceicola]UYM14240.1 CHY zinc finger protein [Endozoicomonas euniceicola]